MLNAAIETREGRFFIKLGFPGFNTRANNGRGYATEGAALAAAKRCGYRPGEGDAIAAMVARCECSHPMVAHRDLVTEGDGAHKCRVAGCDCQGGTPEGAHVEAVPAPVRLDHCTHPGQAWCDCDWCRLNGHWLARA